MKPLITSLGLALAFACTSCQDMNPNVYNARTAGMPMQTFVGVVESVRVVTVQSEGELGTFVGAAAGAIGGSRIGGGRSGHMLGALAGGLAGGVAGNAIGKSASTKPAMEYIVRTEDGQLHTVVQGVEPPTFNAGQRVYVQLFGPGKARVIPRV